MRARVATLNLQHGLSRSGTATDVAGLAEAVRGLGDIDVLAFQEADRGQRRSNDIDQPRVIADALGLQHVRFAATLRGNLRRLRRVPQQMGAPGDGPTYGIGIASRWPVTAWFVHPLPRLRMRHPAVTGRSLRWRTDEQRAALAAVLATPQGPLTVVSVHLSLLVPVAMRQLRLVADATTRLPGPRLLAGDFNLSPWVAAPVVTEWRYDTALTMPARAPRRQIDYLLTHGGRTLDVEALALPISDHCALRGTLVA